MSRLVRIPKEIPSVDGSIAAGPDGEPLSIYLGDSYLERIAKYVPA